MLAYIILCTLPCFAVLIVSSKVMSWRAIAPVTFESTCWCLPLSCSSGVLEQPFVLLTVHLWLRGLFYEAAPPATERVRSYSV